MADSISIQVSEKAKKTLNAFKERGMSKTAIVERLVVWWSEQTPAVQQAFVTPDADPGDVVARERLGELVDDIAGSKERLSRTATVPQAIAVLRAFIDRVDELTGDRGRTKR